MSWWSHLYPLMLLVSTILITYLVKITFEEQDLINPYVSSDFSIRAYEVEEVIETPKTEKEQIIEYITEVFGVEAPNAFNILYCENRGLRADAVNHNRNESIDEGIFQINSIHGQSNMKDWKKNIDFAYKLFNRGGWSQWSCSHRVDVTPFYLK